LVNLPEHALGLLEDSLIREAEDGEAQGTQVDSAGFIMGSLLALLVDGTVELYDEPVARAVEVGDIGADRDLAAELQAQEAAIAEELPERFLGGSLLFAELAGAGGLAGGAQARTLLEKRCCDLRRFEGGFGIGG
jgi:hypothetical protein